MADVVKAELLADSAGVVNESNENNNRALSAPHPVRLLVRGITLAPDTLRLAGSGATAQFTAQLTDRYQRGLSGRPINWSSLAPTIATVLFFFGLVSFGGVTLCIHS